jgi:sigma54-dependent transcription regulator
MTALADGGRITEKLVDEEIVRLKANWIEVHDDDISALIPADQLEQTDAFDRLQLQSVIEVCRSRSSPIGRALLGVSRHEAQPDQSFGSIAEVRAAICAEPGRDRSAASCFAID